MHAAAVGTLFIGGKRMAARNRLVGVQIAHRRLLNDHSVADCPSRFLNSSRNTPAGALAFRSADPWPARPRPAGQLVVIGHFSPRTSGRPSRLTPEGGRIRPGNAPAKIPVEALPERARQALSPGLQLAPHGYARGRQIPELSIEALLWPGR